MDSRIHLLRGCPGADSAKRCDRARRAQAAATVSLLSSRGVPRCHRRRRNQHPFSREGVGCGERGEGCRTRLPRSPLFFQTAFRCSLTGATRARGFSKAFAPATGVLFNPLSPHHVTLKEKLHGEKKKKRGGGAWRQAASFRKRTSSGTAFSSLHDRPALSLFCGCVLEKTHAALAFHAFRSLLPSAHQYSSGIFLFARASRLLRPRI